METHYKHDECQGNTGNLYVRYGYKRGVLGWHYHCHSCGKSPGGLSGFCPADTVLSPTETLQELDRMLQGEAKEVITSELTLPYDMTYQLPVEGKRYMLKYGLTDEEIKLSRFGWSPSLNRLIMPVYSERGLIYWQGRNLGVVDDENPKYKNVYLQGARDIFAQFNRRDGIKGRTLVLVEAIISAIKLSRHVDAVALLGSYIPPSIFNNIYSGDYDKIVLWLDPDKKAVMLSEVYRLTVLAGIPVVACLTDKKPKEYNDKEILCHLN